MPASRKLECYKKNLIQRKKTNNAFSIKTQSSSSKNEMKKYLQDVIFLEGMKYSVHTQWYLKMQNKVLYRQVSFYKKPNIFSWNKNMSSKEYFHRYLLPLQAEQ